MRPSVALLSLLLLGPAGPSGCVAPIADASQCPATKPVDGTACLFAEGTRCVYDASMSRCGSSTCQQGTWQSPFVMPSGCAAPDGGSPAPDAATPFSTCTAFDTTFGPFDKSCAAATDCAFGLHEMSCCGDQAAVGFNVSQRAAFTAAEMTCERGFPGCGCAANRLLVEVGENDGGLSVPVAVDCVSGKCLTRVK